MPLAICTTEHVQGCIMWMYSLPYIMPTPYYAIDPYVSPFLLPMTLCSLTGKCAKSVPFPKQNNFSNVPQEAFTALLQWPLRDISTFANLFQEIW